MLSILLLLLPGSEFVEHKIVCNFCAAISAPLISGKHFLFVNCVHVLMRSTLSAFQVDGCIFRFEYYSAIYGLLSECLMP